jgi:puromycin-sensitive aminopeptidase
MRDTSSYRLPRSVVPTRYQLELVPDIGAARFQGRERVTVRVVQPVTDVVLNAAELDVTSARLQPVDGGGATAAAIGHQPDEERVTLTVDQPLAPGDWWLDLEFSGILNDKLRGFYRSSFTGSQGETVVIATTQFEATDARRAFPCWDEPDFKATFAVTLVVDDGLTALSNGAVEAEEDAGGGRRRVRFAETMPMSTYLVAFVVGPFELTEPRPVNGIPVRVATVPGKGDLTEFGLESATHALEFLARYFEIPYPHDKIDHVAIPDFAFGAMENLGCVTYRENALLADPRAASQLELRRIAQVVSHETAHMWFGDLVTMKWWNGIWLNEAFATFMELTTTDHFRPEWEAWTAFGASKAEAMAIDGLVSTRPIEFPVGPPSEAEAMFDVLTYEKGGSVLRMLEQYLGGEVLRKGIAAYLSEHSYGNTETTDLWDAIEASSGEPVRSIMDSWIFQGGYPLVSVDLTDDGRSVKFHQRRFLYRSGDGGTGEVRWSVPVTLRASVGGTVRRERALLTEASGQVDFEAPVDWVIVNDGAWGFYRVAYSADLFGQLLGMITELDPLERMALVDDAWAAVVAGEAPLSRWVKVVDALDGEQDPDVWLAILAGLDLLELSAPEKDLPALAAFVRRIGRPALDDLGWDPQPGEDQRRGTLRSRLIAAVGILGEDEEVRSEAANRFRRYQDDRSSLPPDLVTAVVHLVAAAGGEDTYETMREQMRRASTPQDQLRYLYALAQPRDPSLLARTLDACLTSEVRSQDAPMLIGRILGSRAGRTTAWEWVEQHWDDTRSRYPNNILIRMVDGATALVEPEWADRARAWLAGHTIPGAGVRQAQLAERLDINAAFAARVGPDMAASLAEPPS